MSLPWPHKTKPNVFLFEPHPLTIECLRTALRRVGQVLVLPCHGSLSMLTAAEVAGSVFIFDKATHGYSVAQGLEKLRSLFPESRAVLLDFGCNPEDQFHMLSLGFKGIVLYEHVAEKLRPAIQSVVSGGYWVEPDVLAQYVLARAGRYPAKDRLDVLTQREIEVATLLKRKLSNKEISVSLAVSEGTVKFHIANIFSKLGVRDRWSAVELLGVSEGSRVLVAAAGSADHPSANGRGLRAS
jgi:DNA-binding NarL/FixJ family response regulator